VWRAFNWGLLLCLWWIGAGFPGLQGHACCAAALALDWVVAVG